MQYTVETIDKVTEMFSALPSIGRKTAQRLTYFLLRQNHNFIIDFSKALINLIENVRFCEQCFNYSEKPICPICSSSNRDSKIICVVSEPNDVVAIERTNEFNGKYHILHGLLNPIGGVVADDLKIKELISRLDNVKEVILAINPSIEGEVTIQFISQLIKPLDIKITRLASGIPIGSAIEYSDEATILRAIEYRINL